MAELIITGRYAINEGVWHVTTAPGVSTEAMPENWHASGPLTLDDLDAIFGEAVPPTDEEIAAILPQAQQDDLIDLVETYERKWPEIIYSKGGSRARKALGFVQAGHVRNIGSDADDHDLWIVSGQQCSKAGKYCSCEDRAHVDPTYGKLCAHRLAVALKTNWMGNKLPRLVDLIASLEEYEYIDLVFDRVYEWNGGGTGWTLIGVHVPGEAQPRLFDQADRYNVTIAQMQWSLETTGYGMADLPEKIPGGYRYYYRIARGGVPCDPFVWNHKGRHWIMEERETSRRMVLIDMARHLPEILAGPLPVTLSRYDAKRLDDLRTKLQAEKATAAEVWNGLPDELKQHLMEVNDAD